MQFSATPSSALSAKRMVLAEAALSMDYADTSKSESGPLVALIGSFICHVSKVIRFRKFSMTCCGFAGMLRTASIGNLYDMPFVRNFTK
jgi:hypothetical protein